MILKNASRVIIVINNNTFHLKSQETRHIATVQTYYQPTKPKLKSHTIQLV